MKVQLNPVVERASGALGELVFREIRGKTFVSRKPVASANPTEEQIAHRERFKKAAAYGKIAMADEAVRPLYEAAAKAKNIPVFSLTIADYFNTPTIEKVDYSQYDGKAGSFLLINATDDFEVVRVNVAIKDTEGNFLDWGDAVQESGHWRYTAKVNVQTEVVLHITATDRPGGTAVQTIPL